MYDIIKKLVYIIRAVSYKAASANADDFGGITIRGVFYYASI